MSSKRYLLILPLLGLLMGLAAQPRFALNTGLFTDEDWEPRIHNRLSVNGSLGRQLDWELESDLYRSQGLSGPQQQVLSHDARASLAYRMSSLRLKAQYANTLYDDSVLMGLYPVWMPFNTYERRMAHQGSMTAGWELGAISIDASGIYRYLRAKPWMLDMSDFQLYPQDPEGFSDLYASGEVGYRIGSDIRVLVAYDHKQGFYSEDATYDMNSVKLGCEASVKPLENGRLEGSVAVSHRSAEAIDDPRANLVKARLRYQHRLLPNLSGFLSWENNSCFDDDLGAIYLISNYLRGQCVYTLDYDASASSYLRLGGKYSPENDASAVFADAEAKLVKGLYAGVGTMLIPERLEQYHGSLGYRLGSAELGLRYQHREFKIYPGKTDLWGLETRVWW